MHTLRARLIVLLCFSLPLLGAVPSAQAQPNVINPKLSGDVVSNEVNEPMFTPDGSRVVYLMETGEFGDVHQLYSAPSDGSAAPALLSQPVPPADTVIDSYQITPDGSRVVFEVLDTTLDRATLHSVPVDGGAITNLTGSLLKSGSVDAYRITPDGTYVIYRADQDMNNRQEVYSVSVSGGTIIRLNRDLPPGGNVLNFAFIAGSNMIVYLAGQDIATRHELYVVPLFGGNPIRLNDQLGAGGTISNFVVRPEGDRLAYFARQELAADYEVYAVIDMPEPVTVNAPATQLPLGETQLMVNLLTPQVLGYALLSLDSTGGDAIAGTDYVLRLPSEPSEAASAVASLDPSRVSMQILPGPTDIPVIIEVLENPNRTAARTVTLSLMPISGAVVGEPGSITLTIPGTEDPTLEPDPTLDPTTGSERIYLPLLNK